MYKARLSQAQEVAVKVFRDAHCWEQQAAVMREVAILMSCRSADSEAHASPDVRHQSVACNDDAVLWVAADIVIVTVQCSTVHLRGRQLYSPCPLSCADWLVFPADTLRLSSSWVLATRYLLP